MNRNELLIEVALAEFSSLQTYRSTFAQQWEEVAELVVPNFRNTFYYGSYNFPGQKKTEKQVDATAMLALGRFSAILDSLLTPRNMTWHYLAPDNDQLAKDRSVKLYFEEVTRVLFKHRYKPTANFSSQNQQVYQSLGAFGNGLMWVDAYQGIDGGRGLRYRALPLGEVYLRENHQGQIDGFCRHFKLTKRQAIRQFGEENLPKEMLEGKNDEALFDFLHRVCPNDEYDSSRSDARGKLFKSCYIAISGRKLVSEGGFNTFPMPASRYDQAPGEVYGRGPAMAVLPAIKTLNAEKRDFLTQGHRAASPVLLTTDDGIVDFSMRPGALNKGGMSADGKRLIDVLPAGDIQISEEMMAVETNLINDAFLVTLFQIMVESPRMTATEVIERTNEKGILLAPTVGRQQSEYLGPLIERELDVLSAQGLLPPMPGILKEAAGEYHVVYTSPLARSMRAQEVAGFQRALETALTVVQATQDPSVLDSFDFDVIIPEVAEIQAVPERWMASPEKIAAAREQRAAAMQKQEQIQAAPAAAALVKAGAQAGK